MLEIVTDLLTQYLMDPENGVNAVAQSLPRRRLRYLPNPRPTDDPAPSIVAIETDVRDESVVTELSPSEVPALMIWGDSSADVSLKGVKYKIAQEVIIAAAYVTDDAVDPIAASRDCSYILRGAMISLSRFNSQDVSYASRELNGIRILEVSSVTEHRVPAGTGRRKLWGFLDIRVIAVETLS